MLDTTDGGGYPEERPDPAEPTASFEIRCSVTLGGEWATQPKLVADSIRHLAENLAARLNGAADDLEAYAAVHDPGDTIEIEEDP